MFYIYDDRMLKHRDNNYHDAEGKIRVDLPEERGDDFVSPEVPLRIKNIFNFLSSYPTEAPLLSKMVKVEIEDKMWEQALFKVHPESLLARIEGACAKLDEGQTSYTLDEDNYECQDTLEAAKLSSKACLTAVDKVLSGHHERGYCIVRPPGHHAHSEYIHGFCFFNNVAVAA